MEKHKHLILGGTFDHFHAGHELFLSRALAGADRLTIGLTTEALYRHKKFSSSIEEYAEREKNILHFMAKNKKKSHDIKILPITTIYGSSLTDVTVDGIVATEETLPGAKLINKKREEIGMKPLDIIRVPLVKAADGRPISSFRIRYGDIDRKGISFYRYFSGKQTFMLPDVLRPRLREPLGALIPGQLGEEASVVKKIIAEISEYSPEMVITIGDIIYRSLREGGVVPEVSVIDGRSRRQALTEKLSSAGDTVSVGKYRNIPGTISYEAVAAIHNARERHFSELLPQLVSIDGEEDLLALPAILFAPLGSVVLYGQFDAGVVLVRVTEDKKKEVLNLLEKFTA